VALVELGDSETADALFGRVAEVLARSRAQGPNRVACDQCSASGKPEERSDILVIPWHEAYECGHPQLDEEHRELFRLANALLAAAMEREENPEAFALALDECLVCIARHVAHEERVLEEHGYAGLEEHRASHKTLLERGRALRAAAANGEATMGAFAEFLACEVVARHILLDDRRYFAALGRAPVGDA